jgi:hypothetical protein
MPKRRPLASTQPYQVFVSHATADKWVACTICEKIDAITGVKTFRDDRDISGGDVISHELREQIQVCDELLVVLTPVSVTRRGSCWRSARRGGTANSSSRCGIM